jgi:hypothetical protein
MPNGVPKLLYIAAWSRSGSTILDQILGQLEGFFTVGELAHVWDRGAALLCGCGRMIKDCNTWERIFTEAFGRTNGSFDFDSVKGQRLWATRLRYFSLLANPVARQLFRKSLEPRLKRMEKLYRAVANVTGAKMIVDSSKRPNQACLLEMCGLGEPYIVHLVRDPRGCAYSYQIPKLHPDPFIGRMRTLHPGVNSLQWLGINAAVQSTWGRSRGRYLLVRYEDFISAPRDTIVRILNLVGEPVPRLPFLSENSVVLEPRHGVAGNPSRFKTGTVDLKLDERWKSGLTQRDKLLVKTITSPLLRKYGYDRTHSRT